MRFSRVLYKASVAALAQAQQFERPADMVLSRYFREHKKLGQQDRATIAETVYTVLRRRRLLASLLGNESPGELVPAAWVALMGANIRELEGFVNQTTRERLAALKSLARSPQPFEVECDLPDWLIEDLGRQFEPSTLLAIANGMLRQAPLDLRVNVEKASREEVLAALTADGVTAVPTPYSPAGLRLAGHPAINRHRLFTEGVIEVQDEGSQLLCYLVGPRRSEMVVDFCAGAGGKTLALGMLMRSAGRLYAFDVSDRRLARLRQRLSRSGLSNVHPQRIDGERDPRLSRLAGKIDRVLVDAPCTGFGTLRRNPDLKWRQTPGDVEALVAKQRAILQSAARLVKPGGRLVYATCSVLEAENRAIVQDFLAANPGFFLVPAGEILAKDGIALAMGDYLELWPHLHGTDGFFAAALLRK